MWGDVKEDQAEKYLGVFDDILLLLAMGWIWQLNARYLWLCVGTNRKEWHGISTPAGLRLVECRLSV